MKHVIHIKRCFQLRNFYMSELEENFQNELKNQDLEYEAELLKVLVEGDDKIPDWQCNSFFVLLDLFELSDI